MWMKKARTVEMAGKRLLWLVVHRWYNRQMGSLDLAMRDCCCCFCEVRSVHYLVMELRPDTGPLWAFVYSKCTCVCLCLCVHWLLVFCEHGRWVLFVLAQEVCSQGSGWPPQCWSTAKEKGLDSCRGGENNLSYMLREKIVMVTTKLPPHWVQ